MHITNFRTLLAIEMNNWAGTDSVRSVDDDTLEVISHTLVGEKELFTIKISKEVISQMLPELDDDDWGEAWKY